MTKSYLSQERIKWAILIGVLFTYILLSFGSSISGDEDIHHLTGSKVLNYYTTLGQDTSYMTGIRFASAPDYAYNFTFDVVIDLANRIAGVEDVYMFRHIFNSIVGWLIILFAGFIAKRYFGWNAFLLTVFMLAFSPKFLGHSMNNPKDIPFAFGYILSIYFIYRFCDLLPKPTWRATIAVGLAIGLCLNFRIGGLLLIPYFGLFVMLRLIMRRGTKVFNKNHFNDYGSIILKGLAASFLAYILMVIFWPFALKAPFSNPFKALEIMTNFAVGIRQLFEGVNVTSTDLPSNYIYKWMYMTIPTVVLLGLVLLPFTYYKYRTKKRSFILITLAFSVIFPIVYAISQNSNVYGGWRHFIFVYPSLVILSAAGYRYLIKTIDNWSPKASYGLYSIVGLLSLHPIIHIIKNHPVEYVYFNEISGGLDNAYGEYEMDYYMHSLKPAMNWLMEEGIINEKDSILIGTNHYYSVSYYARHYDNVRDVYTRYYERLNHDWDYALYVNVYIDQAELKNELYPPTGTIHTIDVNGKPMCAIVKRPSKASIGYADDLKAGNRALAKSKLLEYYSVDQNNFEANINLALIYNQTGQKDSLGYFLKEAQRVNPQRYSRYVGAK